MSQEGQEQEKSTTINAIIRYFEMEGLDIALAAPTGRAAKRMTEATGYEAKTIHRLLELTGMPEESSGGVHFERNAQNPLEADVIIIDEIVNGRYIPYACVAFGGSSRHQTDSGGRCQSAAKCRAWKRFRKILLPPGSLQW